MSSLSDINLMAPETLECPFPAYKVLRDEAPVYRMPDPEIYVVIHMKTG